MKGITALLLVCALLVFGFGDTFAAKKTQAAPQFDQQQIKQEIVPDLSGSQGESVPVPVVNRNEATMAAIVPGTYTIGAAGTYLTLSAAIADLNTNGVDSTLVGNFIFQFIDATITETADLTLGPIVGQYGAGLIIFRPAPATVTTVNWTTTTTFALRLNKVNNVVIDGSNSGGSDRSLTLQIDTVGGAKNVLIVQRSSRNTTVKNTILIGNRRAGGSGGDVLRVINNGLAVPLVTQGQANILIQNNRIYRGNIGILSRGLSAALPDTNLSYIGNLIGGAGSPNVLDNLGSHGFVVECCLNLVFDRNDIYGIKNIVAVSNFGMQTRGGVTGSITNNKIHDMVNYAAGNVAVAGLLVGNLLTTATASFIKVDLTFSNNMFYDFHNPGFVTGASAREMRGIAYNPTGAPNSASGNGSTVRYYHNTFHLRSQTGLDSQLGSMYGMDGNFVGSNTAVGMIDSIDFKNNILSVARDAGSTLTILYIGPIAPAANLVAAHENNLYWKTDGAAFAVVPSPWPAGAAAAYDPFPVWQAGTGQDLNGAFADPKFVSATDAHITTALGVISPADSLGAPVGKLLDIDGDARDPNFPDAGADEFTPNFVTNDIAGQSFDVPSGPSEIQKEFTPFSPKATFRNFGTATQTSVPVRYQIIDGSPAVVYTNDQVLASLAFLTGTAQATFASVPGGLAAGTYTVKAIALNPGDLIPANDTITSTIQVQASISSGAFPYTEDFEGVGPETAGAGWLTAGTSNDWVRGTPAKTQIAGAHTGTKSYVTKLTGTYSANQESDLYAPVLDLTTFVGLLQVEFYQNFDTENDFDGGALQMSTDAGATWNVVDGTLGTGSNFNTPVSVAWYNEATADGNIAAPYWGGGETSGGGLGSNDYSSADANNYIRSSTVVSGVAGLSDVRFRWHFSADGGVNGEGWSIDDVTFKAVLPDDIGVSSVGIPGYLGGPVPNGAALRGRNGEVLTPNATNRPSVRSLGAVVAGGSLDLEAQVSNYGANGQATYAVDMTVDGNPEDSDVNTDNLDFGDTDTLTLSWATPSTGIHQARAWTTMAGDGFASNDTATFDFEVLAPEVVYYEGFNSGTWPSPGWDTLDVDGNGVEPGASWQQDVIAIYEGAHSAGGYYGQSNGLYIDDWLISPNTGSLLDVNYNVDSLSFWVIAAGSGYADSIEIRVSTTGTATSDFTTLLEYIEIPSSGWTKYTYALPNAATRYVAFRYLHYDGGISGGASNAFSLDDVRITRYNFANGLTITPGSINFGLVPSGFGSAETLKVNNNGNVALAISSVASDNADFVVVPGAGVIPPGDSANFVVTFTPSSIGVIAGNIVFTSDADSSPDTATVAGIGGTPLVFLTLSPDSVFNEDPLKPGKSKKPVKHQKHLFPNWSNLIDELNAQGGFGPVTSESDSAGGMVIGSSYMYAASPGTPLTPKWKAVKDSAKIYAWVRLAKWDFKKNIGKSFANIQKTLRDKNIGFHTGPARGLDTTTDGKFKKLAKQLTSLSPKKQSNKLFAELVALKVNIAASAMGKTPAGFGDLIFDTDGNFLDEMSVSQIADMADSLMTHYTPILFDTFDSLYSAVYNINRSCLGGIDTASFDAVDSVNIKGKLTLYGQVNIATVPYLKLPPMPFIATRISALNGEVESPEDFDDEGDFDVESMPVAAQLMQNYPNPFNPSTTIAFRLKEVSKVTVKIFNLLGQEVAVLVNGEELEEGAQSLQFSAEMLSSGVYFYRIEAQGLEDAALKTVETRKMMLLK